MNDDFQVGLFATAAAPARVRDDDRRALDDLFRLTEQYRFTKSYNELLQFIARFRFYSPFNAMLIHTQMPGARYVAPPHRWVRDYERRIKPSARPLVILQPKGPVMFVFDVSDTEAPEGAIPLPPQVENPFAVKGAAVGQQLERTIENAKCDGVRVSLQNAGAQHAGSIRWAEKGNYQKVPVRLKPPPPEYVEVPVYFELLLNSGHSREIRYATLVHELAHLFCGHLGTPNPDWWPDRRDMGESEREFEAESVCYLVCRRQGIDNKSEEYLSGYVKANAEMPTISLDSVMTAAGLIERMGRERMKPRKEKEKE